MNSPTKVSVFLSSPADVTPEREAAEWVVQRLNGVYAAHVELATERWERHFYEADRGFQEAIAPMEAFDIVVGILWKRIGSELPPARFSRPDGTPYESGTVYEIETALAAGRRSGRPSVYVFKSQRLITYTAERVDEERAQKEALDRWWGRAFHDEAGRYVAATNSFGDTEDFETKFENCLVGWLRERGHIPGGPVWDVEAQGSPYPGLVAYDLKHSPVFFGRHLAVESAREELLGADAREGGRPALFVVGASGSGKSSLVRAGLVPRLTRPGVVPGVDLWRTVIMVPAADSLGPLAAHLYASDGLPELAASAQRDPERWARMAAGDPEATADSLAWALDRIGEAERQRAQADRRIETRLLLVVDQLEGLFGTPGQEAFAKVLRALVDGGQVWLLATLRSDRYTDLQLDRDLLALKRAGATYDLPPPGPAEIADIVKGPARAAGLAFAERDGISLARVLVEAVPNADALPLLQMTLAQLFERREGAELTFAAYEAMGGVEGAIAAYADGVFARVPPAAQRELDPLVRALVRDVVRSRSDNQVRFTARDADRKAFETSEARKHLVEVLVDGRLLVSDGSKLRVAHEALLRRWERARGSLRRLADAELRKARLQRALATAAAIVFLAVAGVAIWFWRATTLSASLDRARLFVEQGRGQAEARPLLGLRLALEGLALAPPERTDIRTPIVQTIAEIASRGRIAQLSAKAEKVYTSADGTRFVIVQAEGKSELRDIANGPRSIELTDKVGEWEAFFSPVFFVNDGRVVIVNYVNAPPEVRRTDTGALLATLPNRRVIEPISSDKDVFGVVYSNQNPRTEVRRTDSGAVIARLPSLGKGGIYLLLSSDGTFVVHNRSDGPAQMRRTDGGTVIATLAGDIKTLEFTADKMTFVVGYTNAPPEVRRSDTGAVIATLPGQLRVEEFSPDGSAFVANYTNAPAELRRSSDGVLLSQLAGQVEEYGGATFSPDGSAFVVNYTDAPDELRRSSDGVLLSQLAGQVEKHGGATFSPDGSAFVVNYEVDYEARRRSRSTESTDLPTELRRTADGTVITTFPDIRLNNITFSPDGTTFVVRYNSVELFGTNARTEFELRRTQDGGLLATLGSDIASDIMGSSPAGDLNFDLNYSSNGKNGVVFSPDGSTFVVRYGSGRGELWDARGTPRRLANLGLGLVKAAFVFTSGVERLAVQYGNGQLYLLDIAWLRAMDGDPGQLSAEELVRLACEEPLTSGPWTTAEQAALEHALGNRKPQSCSFADTPNNPT